MYDIIDNEEIKGLDLTKEAGYKEKLPRGYISVSQITQYMKCGEAYYRRYILDEGIPSNSFQVQGRGVHKAAEKLHLSIMGQQPLGLEETLQVYSDLHDKEIVDATIDEEEGTSANVKDVGISLTKKYHSVAMGKETDNDTGFPIAKVQPIAAEKVYRVDIETEQAGKIPFMAVIDLEEADAIADLKTKKKAAPKSEAENSLQLSLYAHITGKPRVRLDQILKPTKTFGVRYKRVEAIRTKKEVLHAVDIMSEVVDDIAAGRFRKTNPDNWWCTEKWCPYWGDCRGRNR